ncbi:hypothetical protein H8K20_03785 [Neobittarella massiliensis]|uniref:DUF4352 domain-containing protein n=1 Tax=Neobittarella massiliensis (ex Bilen et al. 2018) TaxID=2041842 RepID=A0A8J6IKY4_9FIRM|nr:hypothetical protein [Neobittarella massiliensis]MBC3515519.1 hypothetical protein [Neobittarella massiliensis]
MKQRRVNWLPLAAVTGLLLSLLLSLGLLIPAHDRYRRAQYEPAITVHGLTATRLGTSYRGKQADSGRSFWQVQVEVENTGGTTQQLRYLSLYFEGNSYSDVEEVEENSDETLFYYQNTPVLPAGQRGQHTVILEVADGLPQLNVRCYSGIEGDEKTWSLPLDWAQGHAYSLV